MARPALSQISPLERFPWWRPQFPPQLAKPSLRLAGSQGGAFLRGGFPNGMHGSASDAVAAKKAEQATEKVLHTGL